MSGNPFELSTDIRTKPDEEEAVETTPERKPRIIRSKPKDINEKDIEKLDEIAVKVGVATKDEEAKVIEKKQAEVAAELDKLVAVTYRLPQSLLNALDSHADNTGLKKTAIVKKAIENYCKENGIDLP